MGNRYTFKGSNSCKIVFVPSKKGSFQVTEWLEPDFESQGPRFEFCWSV